MASAAFWFEARTMISVNEWVVEVGLQQQEIQLRLEVLSLRLVEVGVHDLGDWQLADPLKVGGCS